MESVAITPAEFRELLSKLYNQETSYDRKQWSENNPSFGHCAIVAVLAQEVFGGFVQWAKIMLSEKEKLISHYWNILPDGTVHDFTGNQFRGKIFELPKGRNVTNNLVFVRVKKSKRYNLFAQKFCEAMKKCKQPLPRRLFVLFKKPCYIPLHDF